MIAADKQTIEQTILAYFGGYERRGIKDGRYAASYLKESDAITASLTKRRDARSNNLVLERLEVDDYSDVMARGSMRLAHSYVLFDDYFGTSPCIDIYDGDILLLKERDSWKIAAFTQEGRSTLDSLYVRPQGLSVRDGVEIRARRVVLQRKWAHVVLSIQNHRPEAVVLGSVKVRGVLRPRPGHVEYGVTIRAGDSLTALAFIEGSFPRSTRVLRVNLARKEAGRRMRNQRLKISIGPSGRAVLQEERPDLALPKRRWLR